MVVYKERIKMIHELYKREVLIIAKQFIRQERNVSLTQYNLVGLNKKFKKAIINARQYAP